MIEIREPKKKFVKPRDQKCMRLLFIVARCAFLAVKGPFGPGDFSIMLLVICYLLVVEHF